MNVTYAPTETNNHVTDMDNGTYTARDLKVRFNIADHYDLAIQIPGVPEIRVLSDDSETYTVRGGEHFFARAHR